MYGCTKSIWERFPNTGIDTNMIQPQYVIAGREKNTIIFQLQNKICLYIQLVSAFPVAPDMISDILYLIYLMFSYYDIHTYCFGVFSTKMSI